MLDLKKDKQALILYGIILVGIGIRFYNIDMPIFEANISSAMTRAIQTRNLYRHWDILNPQLDFMPQPYYYYLEFPFYNFLVALLYLIRGGVYEYLGRAVSILAFAGSSVVLFNIAKRYFNLLVARFTVFCFVLSPLNIINSRTFQPDATALFLSLLGLWFIIRWLDSNRISYYWLSVICTMIAFLTRITMMYYVLLIILAMVYEKRGTSIIKEWHGYIFCLVTILPSIGWYAFALQYQQSNDLNDVVSWFSIADKFSYYRLKHILERWILILTPLGFAPFFLGLLIKIENTKRETKYLFYSWFASILIYNSLIQFGAADPNNYMVISTFTSLAVARSMPVFLKSNLFMINKFSLCLLFMVLVVLIFGYSNSSYVIPRSTKYYVESAKAIKRFSKPEDLIIGGKHAGALLYYSDRKGWGNIYDASLRKKTIDYWAKQANIHSYTNDPISYLEILRSNGANYFIEPDLLNINTQKRKVIDYCMDNFEVVDIQPEKYIIFNLSKTK